MEHTQGKIRYDYEPGYCGELIAENGTSLCSFTDEPVAGNARRLVACWNACEGVSTEWLEAQTDPASEELFGKVAPLDKRLQSAMQEFAALKAQRDELLEALAFYANPGDYKAPFTGGLGKLYYDCGETARALIAKPIGGAARATEGSV